MKDYKIIAFPTFFIVFMLTVSWTTAQCVNEFCANCTNQNFCTACVDGRWGDTCMFECECPGKCEFSYGYCLSCPEGYYAARKCIKCPDNCNRCSHNYCYTCYEGFTNINGNCYDSPTALDTCSTPRQPDTLACDVCKDGWHGSRCEYQCANCLHGQCSKNGYCPCVQGYYGSGCTGKCNFGCKDGVCDSYNGYCSCRDGYYNNYCSAACDSNCLRCERYSYNCSVCKPGYWGRGCSSSCRPGCLNIECDKDTGQCNETCSPLCLECESDNVCARCSSGYYGDSCNETCGPACLHNTCDSAGRCACVPGYNDEPYCDKSTAELTPNSTTALMIISIIGLVLAVASLIAAVIFKCVQCRRCSRQNMKEPSAPKKEPTVSFSDLTQRGTQDGCLYENAVCNTKEHDYEIV